MAAYSDVPEDAVPYVQGVNLDGRGVVYAGADVTVNVITKKGTALTIPLKAGTVFPLFVQRIVSTTTAAANTVFLLKNQY
jgi:hypothetical protein